MAENAKIDKLKCDILLFRAQMKKYEIVAGFARFYYGPLWSIASEREAKAYCACTSSLLIDLLGLTFPSRPPARSTNSEIKVSV